MGRTLKALKRNAEAETALRIALDLLPQVKKGVIIAFIFATVFIFKLCKAYQPLSFFIKPPKLIIINPLSVSLVGN